MSNLPQSQKTFKSGDIIMHQGEPGDSAYIIETGRVEILVQKDGEDVAVGTRGAGTMIGEMALVDGAPRTATVKALEDCSLLEITQEDFSSRLDGADPILKMTTQVILTRYRDMLTRANIIGDNKKWPPAEMVELNYAQGSAAVETVKIANEFKDALRAGEVHLHYQPIVDLNDGSVQGFEALMRWDHPEKGAISPGVFIPVIEDSGFIVEASKWALEESLLALKRIEGQTGYNDSLFMSVNFSSRDFAANDFVDSINNTLSKTGVKPQNVHLEITERLLMGQPDQAKETLEMCREAGIEISIDDFGTGYSSLSYLHFFPINTLKIDQSFTRGMLDDAGVMELVKSIIGLSQNMGLKTIAEGVEEKEHGEALKELGCELAQGYYFARPMSESDVIEYIKKSA